MSYEGKKNYAGHYLLGNIINYLKNSRFLSYDLGGVDPTRNKAVFDFKKGTGAERVFYCDEKLIGGVLLKLIFNFLCLIKFYVKR